MHLTIFFTHRPHHQYSKYLNMSLCIWSYEWLTHRHKYTNLCWNLMPKNSIAAEPFYRSLGSIFMPFAVCIKYRMGNFEARNFYVMKNKEGNWRKKNWFAVIFMAFLRNYTHLTIRNHTVDLLRLCLIFLLHDLYTLRIEWTRRVFRFRFLCAAN